MAASETKTNLEDVLKPFYQRASEVEDRLSRLEASVASNRDAGSKEHLKTISELQAKLEGANAELALEREKAKKLAVENGKLQYRVIHLVQAIREGDAKLESLIAGKVVQKQVQRLSRNWRIYDYELRERALPSDIRIGWQLCAIPQSDKVYVDIQNYRLIPFRLY
ncbi:hypothetical protein POTOM_024775 [Populus tomentosa]|uniref:Uncharacterized protein n=1 Tax=Populus tomentosa TaxID=118781 RepID=A0A8X8CXU9_POPTO|nr:hypothetical protein POTOM_024775 [Populus tomentosa]